MRTKTLLLAAALTAAGIASIQAQSNVYSINVVGYYNVTVPTGATPDNANRFKAVCMQLKPNGIASPTLNNAFTNLPIGTLAYVWSGTGWNPPTEYLGPVDGGWETDYSLPYGTGVMLKNTAASDITVTVVGEVMQGSLTNTWGVGFSPRGPLVPQAGGITAVHKFSQVGDKVLVFNAGWSPQNEYFGGPSPDDWELGEPNLSVGQAVMVNSLTGGSWVRDFTVPATP